MLARLASISEDWNVCIPYPIFTGLRLSEEQRNCEKDLLRYNNMTDLKEFVMKTMNIF